MEIYPQRSEVSETSGHMCVCKILISDMIRASLGGLSYVERRSGVTRATAIDIVIYLSTYLTGFIAMIPGSNLLCRFGRISIFRPRIGQYVKSE